LVKRPSMAVTTRRTMNSGMTRMMSAGETLRQQEQRGGVGWQWVRIWRAP
jgi:hypothetical protein